MEDSFEDVPLLKQRSSLKVDKKTFKLPQSWITRALELQRKDDLLTEPATEAVAA
jgi:hypothetical protein